MLLRLRDRAADLLITKKPRLTTHRPERTEEVQRTVRLIEASPQTNTEAQLKKIETLEQMLGEKEEKIKRYQTNEEENLKTILCLEKKLRDEADKMTKMLSDAKKEIETVTAEKFELSEASGYRKELEALLEKSQGEVENQKTTITNLENKLKFQGKLCHLMIFFFLI